MITNYVHFPDGELLVQRVLGGDSLYRAPHARSYQIVFACGYTRVAEGDDAEREFMNHFGDDSSWPTGWREKMRPTT